MIRAGAPFLLPALLLAGAPDRPLDGRIWTDESGRTVGAGTWAGSPALVATFYRGCQLTCPRTLAGLRRVEAAFRWRGQPLEILLITLDPGSDPPAELLAFKRREALSEHWHLLNAPRRQVAAFCREQLGWTPLYDDGHVTHGSGCLLLDGQGRLLRKLIGWNVAEADLAALAAATPRQGGP